VSAANARDRKLVIAAESLGGAEAALSFCRTILEWGPAKPRGLIIEPDGTPFWTSRDQRLVSTSGAVLAVPPPDRLRRIARGDANLLGARLASLAAALDTDWACEVSRGELVSAACAAVAGNDILLLGQRRMLRRSGKVLLLEAEHGPSEASRSLAEALARATSTSVVAMRKESQAEKDDIVSRVDRSYACAVVVDLESGPFKSADDLRRLFAAARCPVAVLGGSHLSRSKVDTGP
jgi:hypothetical protein